jgi:hypothetical protein
MRRITMIAAGLAIAAGVGVAFTLPAGAVVSQESPPVAAIQVQSPGVLVSRGAAVTVPVLIVCSPGRQGQVNVVLTQRVGSSVANGSGSISIQCTGSLQIVEVLVTANNKAFKKGGAVGEAFLFVCSNFGCSQASDQQTIQLTNKP